MRLLSHFDEPVFPFNLQLFIILEYMQIYKLELEQKRLEEDAFVHNWLQQQLKLSPAYKKVKLIILPGVIVA